jgi:hypothetical protein
LLEVVDAGLPMAVVVGPALGVLVEHAATEIGLGEFLSGCACSSYVSTGIAASDREAA